MDAVSSKLVSRLWSWSSYTGDPLFSAAADEIERLHKECQKLASLLMSEYTWVHEYKVAEVDKALEPYIGKQHDASVESSATS